MNNIYTDAGHTVFSHAGLRCWNNLDAIRLEKLSPKTLLDASQFVDPAVLQPKVLPVRDIMMVGPLRLRVGIGRFVKSHILEHPESTNKQILALVLETFPLAKTSYACIAWYKTKLRNAGQIG